MFLSASALFCNLSQYYFVSNQRCIKKKNSIIQASVLCYQILELIRHLTAYLQVSQYSNCFGIQDFVKQGGTKRKIVRGNVSSYLTTVINITYKFSEHTSGSTGHLGW